MIKATSINKTFNNLKVLKEINLEVKKGEIVTIIGPSGAGKTTLLEILGTLSLPDKNKKTKIELNGTDVSSFKKNDLAKFRNQNLGFIFQFHKLLPEFNSIENVCLPAWIGNKNNTMSKNKAKELLVKLGLSRRLTHYPSELSGGEQQRVAVARALINNPSLLLADEPTGNLDSDNAKKIQELFKKINKELGLTIVLVTHNEKFSKIARKCLVLKDGKWSK